MAPFLLNEGRTSMERETLQDVLIMFCSKLFIPFLTVLVLYLFFSKGFHLILYSALPLLAIIFVIKQQTAKK